MSNPDSPRLLRVIWDGPLSVAQVLSLGGDRDYGVYQVYGRHVVFGAGALLYVGMARDRPFGTRFGEHAASWLSTGDDISIRLGRIADADVTPSDSDWSEWKQNVSEIEALTIFWHSPPYNSKNISAYKGRPLTVQNWRQRGSLLPEYSSHWPELLRPPGEDDGC